MKAKNYIIILLAVGVVALPFLFQKKKPAGQWRSGDPVLVVVTPHIAAIRDEFSDAFSEWHFQRYGKPVRIDWRALGGTTEIMRYLGAEYVTAFKAYQRRERNAVPDSAFRSIDDAAQFTSKIDVFFGGGVYDHTVAERQGLIVPTWEEGKEPDGLFVDAEGVEQLPFGMGGEIWRGRSFYSAALSSFGICYNPDRLEDLGVTVPPATWDDLTDPKYFGLVGVADPTKSGSIAKAFELIVHTGCLRAVLSAGFTPDDIRRLENEINVAQTFLSVHNEDTEFPRYQRAIEQGWRDGLRTVMLIGANARYFTDGAGKVPVDVSAGDTAVGIAIDFYARVQAETSVAPSSRGSVVQSFSRSVENGIEPTERLNDWTTDPRRNDRLVFVAPVGGTSVNGDPIGILRGAPNREIAERFVEFVLGTEGQKLWNYRVGTPGGPKHYALRRLPARREFYASAEHARYTSDALTNDAINAYALAEQFEYIPRWTGSHFGVFRTLVRSMCMDAGEELRTAWKAIIAAGGPGQCPEAMEQLCQLPDGLTWQTAASFGSGDTLETSRQWTLFFRQSYAEALRKAERRE